MTDRVTDRVTESCHHPVKSGPEKLQRKAETLETEGVGEELEGGEEERRGMEGEEGGGEFKVCYQALRARICRRATE